MALRAACAAGLVAMRRAGRPVGAALTQRCFIPGIPAGAPQLTWGSCATAPDGRRFAASNTVILPLEAAIEQVLKGSGRNFVERVDVCFQTALDPRKADHMIRGLVKLPHGTGKKVKLAVFASGEAAETAKKLGVEHVGLEDLIDKVKGGKIDFERCLATPQAMPKLNSIARILGPRGLMPSPKTRTVTDDIEGGIKSVISGLMFKVDKHGYVHGSIGKIDFKPEEIKENLLAFLTAITDLRPKSLSGQFLKGCSMSSTMGHGIHIRISDLTGSPTESPSLASQKKGARRKGVDPAAWGTVDLSQVKSMKLRNYLIARRKAEGLDGDTPQNKVAQQ